MTMSRVEVRDTVHSDTRRCTVNMMLKLKLILRLKRKKLHTVVLKHICTYRDITKSSRTEGKNQITTNIKIQTSALFQTFCCWRILTPPFSRTNPPSCPPPACLLLLPITADRTPPGAAGNNGWPIQGSMPGHWWALIPSPADVINDMAHMFQQPRLSPPASFVSTSKGSYAVKNVTHTRKTKPTPTHTYAVAMLNSLCCISTFRQELMTKTH